MCHKLTKSDRLFKSHMFHLNNKGAILERKKTNTFNNNFSFTSTLISLTENAYRIAYTKG
jgi:hypothetical protein